MKKIIYALFASTLITSCYQDEGNYEYSFDKMNAITAVNFEPAAEELLGGLTIEFTQPLTEADTLKRVNVTLEQTLNTNPENLEYIWARTYKDAEGTTIKDTVRTQGYMDVVLPVGRSMSYTCLLQVRDKTTDLSHYTKFTVATRPIFKNSTFILHGQAGNRLLGNIEKVGADVNVRTDAYKLIYPGEANPFGDANKLMYQATNTFVNWTKLVEINNFIVFSDGREAKIFNPFGMTPRNQNLKNYVLPTSEQGIPAVAQIGMVGDPSNQSDYYYIIAKDGRVVTARALLSFKYPYQDEGETDYNITAAAITSNDFVFWDNKNSRFLHVGREDSYGIWGEQEAYDAQLNNPLLDANVDFSGIGSELSPVGKTAVYGYIQYRENFENEQPYFVFKDDSNQYFLYELTPTQEGKSGSKVRKKGDEKDSGESTEPAYTIKAQKLDGFTPSDVQSIHYNTWFSSNYLFYIDGSSIIRYNVSNGDKLTIYTAPNGYTVACMKIREENTLQFSADLGLYIGIGLNKGDKGAFTEIKLNTAGDLDETYTSPIYSQDNDGVEFGNIADIQFVHEYSYKLPQY